MPEDHYRFVCSGCRRPWVGPHSESCPFCKVKQLQESLRQVLPGGQRDIEYGLMWELYDAHRLVVVKFTGENRLRAFLAEELEAAKAELRAEAAKAEGDGC